MNNKETFLGTFTNRLNNDYIQNAKLDFVFLCSFFSLSLISFPQAIMHFLIPVAKNK